MKIDLFPVSIYHYHVAESDILCQRVIDFYAKSKDRETDMVTMKWHSRTTSRHINEFLGGKEYTNDAAKVPQSLLDNLGKFIEAYHNG